MTNSKLFLTKNGNSLQTSIIEFSNIISNYSIRKQPFPICDIYNITTVNVDTLRLKNASLGSYATALAIDSVVSATFNTIKI